MKYIWMVTLPLQHSYHEDTQQVPVFIKVVCADSHRTFASRVFIRGADIFYEKRRAWGINLPAVNGNVVPKDPEKLRFFLSPTVKVTKGVWRAANRVSEWLQRPTSPLEAESHGKVMRCKLQKTSAIPSGQSTSHVTR